MGISIGLRAVLSFEIDGDDINTVIGLFRKLSESKKRSGYVKTADIVDQEWEVIDSICGYFAQVEAEDANG